MDPRTGQPLVILKETNGNAILPIWIGPLEGASIAVALSGGHARPMTHDFVKNILDDLKVKVEKVVVTDLKEGTYYAEIRLTFKGEQHMIDCRPSDAIATALRVGCHIYVKSGVFEKQHEVEQATEESEFVNWLKTVVGPSRVH